MNFLRIGKVSSVNYEQGTVDVIFEDEEDNVRTDISMIANEYQMPDVKDLVVVGFQGNSGNSEQAYILGRISENHIPAIPGKGKYCKKFSDTASVTYDPDTDTLTIDAGKVVIKNLKEG